MTSTPLTPLTPRTRSTARKLAGAYYTPPQIARDLVGWAVRDAGDRLLDPSCGDGRFLACHTPSVGIEQDSTAARMAAAHAPNSVIHHADFFEWAASTHERFDCAAGNPPFIRYQSFKGEVRRKALDLCAAHGARFTGLASSWAPFLVAAATLIAEGGRMAFVVPAELGHAPYAAPLLEYLVTHFGRVRVVAVREKLFPDLSEDCWLLFAEDRGGRAECIDFTVCDRYRPGAVQSGMDVRVALGEWREAWGRRLRPYLLTASVRALYRAAVTDRIGQRLGEVASVGIGYVSGANDFFHLRPSVAARLGIPDAFLRRSIRNGRMLPNGPLTAAAVDAWCADDEPVLLLHIERGAHVPAAVRRYLESPAGVEARTAYKCRTRNPWYAVPDVRVPEYLLSYMAGRSPSLARNDAGVACTNAVHAVRPHDLARVEGALARWDTPFVRLSCELEGHPLGGGMLKLEPREAARVVLPSADAHLDDAAVSEGLATMRRWRHYDD